MASSARRIDFLGHQRSQGWGETGMGSHCPYTALRATFAVRDPGPSHVCGIYYTTDFWKTRNTQYAQCVRIDGPYGPGGAEQWVVSVEFPTHDIGVIEYVIFCFDHKGTSRVEDIYHTNGGDLHRVGPVVSAPRAEAPRLFARASGLNRRREVPARDAGEVGALPAVRSGAAPSRRERPAAGPRLAAVGTPAAAATLASAARYMNCLMLRNFATNTWQLKAGDRTSLPGCIIASPSRPEDPFTDQDYVNYWVRDAAICVSEVVLSGVTAPDPDFFDDCVTFARKTQESAEPGHACFRIDGTRRDWSTQSDGPALRIASILDLIPRLSPTGTDVARTVLRDDVQYVLGAYMNPTTNPWEEARGMHFFTRAVHKRALERILGAGMVGGLGVEAAAVQTAIDALTGALDEHWTGSYYRATVGGDGPGRDVNSDTILAIVHGELPPTNERVLATAAKVWDAFRTLYSINHWDDSQGLGPSIGRYPEDTYDGDIDAMPNVGHPWPLCTAAFATLYYRAAQQLSTDAAVTINATNRRFYEQAGISYANGVYPAASSEFESVRDGLIAAGDRMLGAILYHSDHLELSEQCNRESGYQMSVRNLTWSYAAFIRAARARSGS